jgi:hypothetical protein
MYVEDIAKVCHEANKAYCETLGDKSQQSWESAPQWQRVSAINGVSFHLSGDYPPESSHISWMKEKIQAGWKYGPIKDADKKEHPCLVPFEQLPIAQQIKDILFRNIVHALK